MSGPTDETLTAFLNLSTEVGAPMLISTALAAAEVRADLEHESPARWDAWQEVAAYLRAALDAAEAAERLAR